MTDGATQGHDPFFCFKVLIDNISLSFETNDFVLRIFIKIQNFIVKYGAKLLKISDRHCVKIF